MPGCCTAGTALAEKAAGDHDTSSITVNPMIPGRKNLFMVFPNLTDTSV
jgi:hypothetical protein